MNIFCKKIGSNVIQQCKKHDLLLNECHIQMVNLAKSEDVNRETPSLNTTLLLLCNLVAFFSCNFAIAHFCVSVSTDICVWLSRLVKDDEALVFMKLFNV